MKKKVQEDSLFNYTKLSCDPFDYYVEQLRKNSYKPRVYTQILSFYTIENGQEDISRTQRELERLFQTAKEEKKREYYNGNNEVAKNFNQNCFICYEKDIVFAFRLFGHQYLCEKLLSK